MPHSSGLRCLRIWHAVRDACVYMEVKVLVVDKVRIWQAIIATLMLWLAAQPIAHAQNLEEQLTDYFYDYFQSEAG